MKWNMLFQNILIVFTSLFYSVDLCSACPCIPKHPQYRFCHADFVIRATVTARYLERDPEAPAFDRLLYNVTVHNIYKDSTRFPIGTQTTVFSTNPNHDTCGITLTVGPTYLITGHIRWNGLSINMCDWIPVYNSMSYIQKIGIGGVYGQNCNCMISNPLDYYDMCHDRHGILYENYDGICRWRVDMTRDVCSLGL